MYSPKRKLRLFRSPGWSSSDNIAKSLTTSLSAYNSASNGTWVSITSNEYTALQTNVSNTTIGMTTTAQLALCSNGTYSSSAYIATNVVDAYAPAIPANSYVYAAVYRYALAGQTGIQFYRNTASNVYSNFTQVGGDLPTTINGYNYVVLKDTNATAVSSASLMSVYTNTANPVYFLYKHFGTVPTTVNARYLVTAGPITTSTNVSTIASGITFAIQTLSTTSKQW